MLTRLHALSCSAVPATPQGSATDNLITPPSEFCFEQLVLNAASIHCEPHKHFEAAQPRHRHMSSQAAGHPGTSATPNSSRGGRRARTSSTTPPVTNKTRRSSSSSSSSSSRQQQPPQLSAEFLLEFERRGFCVTRRLLAPQQLQPVKQCVQATVDEQRLEALKHRVRVLCPPRISKQLDSITTPQQALQLIASHGSSELGFLQFFNLHRTQPVIDQLVRDRQLAGTAAQLLGVRKLRLYQDCVFLKEPGYAETNFHSDLRMAPLDTNAFVTAWIPLRPVQGGERDSGLVFAVGSHRDFALPFWHKLQGRDLADRGYFLEDTGPMAVADISWHHGWCLHAAAPQPPNTPPRLALAVCYFADGARLLAQKSDPSVHQDMLHDEDSESYGSWLRELPDGAVARHAQLPLVYAS